MGSRDVSLISSSLMRSAAESRDASGGGVRILPSLFFFFFEKCFFPLPNQSRITLEEEKKKKVSPVSHVWLPSLPPPL